MEHYDFDPRNLPQDLLAAIGLMTTSAAHTESCVDEAIAGCLGVDYEYGQAVTTHMTMPLRFSRSFGGEGRRSRDGDDHRHLTAYQLSCQRRQSIILAFGKAVFDRNIAPLDVTGFGQALAQYRHYARAWRRKTCAKIADHRHRRLLRARRERPARS
jgi:hypothetical protein